MSAHTPAPWAVNPWKAQVDAMPDLLPVCQLLWPTSERTEAETEANAHLIAAAPELLEALRGLVNLDATLTGDHDEDAATWVAANDAARAAIAKATQP